MRVYRLSRPGSIDWRSIVAKRNANEVFCLSRKNK